MHPEITHRRAVTSRPDDAVPHARYAEWLAAEGRLVEALVQQQEACRRAPRRADLLYTLGMLSARCGYSDEAHAAWRFAVQLAPGHYLAQLRLGRSFEQRARRHDATRHYFRAITVAQMQGHWLDDATLPEELAADVLHAMDYVRSGRVEVLASLLDPLEARFGKRPMQRVRACLMGHLGIEDCMPEDPRQRPKFLYFPGLDAAAYLDTAAFDWVARLEDATPRLRDEALRAVSMPDAATSFLEFGPGDRVDDYLAGGELPPRWDAIFFYRHGRVQPNGGRLCPATSTLLESIPLMRIEGHAPEVCFSILAPGTHIRPHHGVTNVRAVVHLPLVVPPDCALVVADEPREWIEGRCLAFDDTFLHEAYNRSAQVRIILLMDAWHPGLSMEERAAMAEIIEGIGAFNRGT